MLKTLLRVPKESRVMVVLSLTVLLQVLVLSVFGLSALKGQAAETERQSREVCRRVLDRYLVEESARRVTDAVEAVVGGITDLPVHAPLEDPVLGRALADASGQGGLVRHAFLITPEGAWYDSHRRLLWPAAETSPGETGGDLAWPYEEVERHLDGGGDVPGAIELLERQVERAAVDLRPWGLVLLARLYREDGRPEKALAIYDELCRDYPTALDRRPVPPVPVGPEAARCRAELRLAKSAEQAADGPAVAGTVVSDLLSWRTILLVNRHQIAPPRLRWEEERLREAVQEARRDLPPAQQRGLEAGLARIADREDCLLTVRDAFGGELLAAAEGRHPGGRLEELLPTGPCVVRAVPLADPQGRARGAVALVVDYRRVVEEILPELVTGLPLPEGVAATVRDAEERPVVGGTAADGAVLARQAMGAGLPFHHAEARVVDPGLVQRQAASIRRLNYAIMALAIAGILAAGWFASRTVRRELRVARMKSDFLSNVTHELKTPLTSIRMFVETLEEGRVRDESERQEYLHVISREAERLQGLIQRVLDFSRIEGRGGGGLRRERTDLGKLARETAELFRTRLAESETRLVTEVPEDLPLASLDAKAVQEMLLNLLGNAEKYGGTEVRLSVAAGDNDVRFTVADDGIGIPESEHDQIFEKFYRVNDTLARDVEGSGLGLAFVREVARAHEGRVKVASRRGEGSRFVVTLPLR